MPISIRPAATARLTIPKSNGPRKISGKIVTISNRMAIADCRSRNPPSRASQLQQTVRRVDCYPPAAHVDIDTNRVGERYQMLPPISAANYQEIGPPCPHQPVDYPNNIAADIHNFRADDFVFVEFAL